MTQVAASGQLLMGVFAGKGAGWFLATGMVGVFRSPWTASQPHTDPGEDLEDCHTVCRRGACGRACMPVCTGGRLTARLLPVGARWAHGGCLPLGRELLPVTGLGSALARYSSPGIIRADSDFVNGSWATFFSAGFMPSWETSK